MKKEQLRSGEMKLSDLHNAHFGEDMTEADRALFLARVKVFPCQQTPFTELYTSKYDDVVYGIKQDRKLNGKVDSVIQEFSCSLQQFALAEDEEGADGELTFGINKELTDVVTP